MFWFEAWGLMALAWVVIVAPFSCWEGGCGPSGEPAVFRDGIVAAWLLLLFVVAAAASLISVLTARRRLGRSFGYLALGLAAFAGIGVALLIGGPLAAGLAAFWTGWPGLVLVVTSIQELRAAQVELARSV